MPFLQDADMSRMNSAGERQFLLGEFDLQAKQAERSAERFPFSYDFGTAPLQLRHAKSCCVSVAASSIGHALWTDLACALWTHVCPNKIIRAFIVRSIHRRTRTVC